MMPFSITARLRGGMMLAAWACAVAASATAVHAQITTDGTVGPARVLSGPHFQITEDLGRRVGPNLFHSFQEFNIRANETATFSASAGIANVIARVTGGGASSIEGTLRSTIPNADFYLVNPAGVVFGPGARLDVSGAFVVTTADVLKLADGGRFDASNPANDLLTMAAPADFGFIAANPASVHVNGATLTVAPGRSMTVAAGGVQIVGGRVEAPGGRIELDADTVSVSEGGTVSADNGGAIAVNAGESVTLTGPASIAAAGLSLGGSGGAAGSVAIDTGLLRITDDAFISVSSIGQGAAGSVSITADRVELSRAGSIMASAGGSGGGTVTIDATSVEASDAATIAAATSGSGDAGRIAITADTLRLTAGAMLTTSTQGTGRGGDITIDARDVAFDGMDIGGVTGVMISAFGDGDGGTLSLQAHGLRLVRGGGILGLTLGGGRGGTIDVHADEVVIDSGTAGVVSAIATSTSQPVGGGTAGSIHLDAGDLLLTTGGAINAVTLGDGRGGDIAVQARTIRLKNGGNISAQSAGTGDAGAIALRADQLDLRHAGTIASSAEGNGDGGNVTITAGRSIRLRTGSVVSAAAQGANAGDVTLSAARLTLLHSSVKAAAAFDGGSILVAVPGQVYLDGSKLTARAGRNGAAITIQPADTVLLDASVIDGRAAGTPVFVTIDPTAAFLKSSDSAILTRQASLPPELDLAGSIVGLPVSLHAADAQLFAQCTTKLQTDLSSFVVVGRGGLPVEPGFWLPAFDLRPLEGPAPDAAERAPHKAGVGDP
jgi:filamentous hemagglutinin family protein